MRKMSSIAIIIGFTMQSAPVAASEFQSLPDLDMQIAQHMRAAIGETGGARREIDRRLKLARCPDAPVLEKRNSSLLVITCSTLNWRISVPLIAPRPSAAAHAADAIVVKRGQPVLMTASKGNFVVSRQMIADRSGAVGDLIPVKTGPRTQAILAEITGPGRVKLP